LENILFENEMEDSTIKIADFGLSALQGPFQDATDVLGTLHYVAPEVLSNKPYDYSVDVWSLGVILFVLVTGCYPFDALNCQTEKK
jgi:serine/threonine protein kinase